MENNELLNKVVAAFKLAGVKIKSVLNREDDATAISCDLMTHEIRKGVHDYFNLTIHLDGQVVWHDFSHTTPLGDSKDTKEALAERLRNILAVYEANLSDIREQTDLNNLLPPYPPNKGYDDVGHQVYVVVTRRKDKGVPKLEKVADEKFHLFERDANKVHEGFTGEIGDYYEVRPVMIYFCPPIQPRRKKTS